MKCYRVTKTLEDFFLSSDLILTEKAPQEEIITFPTFKNLWNYVIEHSLIDVWVDYTFPLHRKVVRIGEYEGKITEKNYRPQHLTTKVIDVSNEITIAELRKFPITKIKKFYLDCGKAGGVKPPCK